jgi:signal transduction histidine kinase
METGGGCEVTVADDGRGMSFEAARRAFDPFYSGREAGRGAGLGLSKAWRLVEASGGTMLLDSRPGQGTRVSILLPEAEAAPIQSQAQSAGA